MHMEIFSLYYNINLKQLPQFHLTLTRKHPEILQNTVVLRCLQYSGNKQTLPRHLIRNFLCNILTTQTWPFLYRCVPKKLLTLNNKWHTNVYMLSYTAYTCMKAAKAFGDCSLIFSMATLVSVSSLQASMTSFPAAHSDLATSNPTPDSAPVTIATQPVILTSLSADNICTIDTNTSCSTTSASQLLYSVTLWRPLLSRGYGWV